jgi:hypothetical protein
MGCRNSGRWRFRSTRDHEPFPGSVLKLPLYGCIIQGSLSYGYSTLFRSTSSYHASTLPTLAAHESGRWLRLRMAVDSWIRQRRMKIS